MPEAEVAEVPEVAAPAVPEGVEQPVEGGEPAEKPAAESAPAETPEGDKPAEPEDTPEKRGINALNRKLRRAWKQAAEQKARADLLERQQMESRQGALAEVTGDLKLEDFNYDPEAFARAVNEKAEQRILKKITEKQQAEARQHEIAVLAASWEEKVARAEEKYDDFDEIVGDKIKPVGQAFEAIMDAENGGDVAYFLLHPKNRKELNRIAALSERSQIFEIAKLSAKLMSEPPKPKTPSKAPAPISPVGGTKGSSNDEPSDKDDINTWIKKENERMKRLNGA